MAMCSFLQAVYILLFSWLLFLDMTWHLLKRGRALQIERSSLLECSHNNPFWRCLTVAHQFPSTATLTSAYEWSMSSKKWVLSPQYITVDKKVTFLYLLKRRKRNVVRSACFIFKWYFFGMICKLRVRWCFSLRSHFFWYEDNHLPSNW